MDPIIDWQSSRHEIKARGTYLLETGKWSDCSFLVVSGPDQSNSVALACHKIILAMASPVFETMFFGSIQESGNPIIISDVQADAFKALLEYIYTDKINITNVDRAFDLCYAAKKYMLPYVVDQCTKYLWSDLSAKNACRAYEFAKLFEEPRLMEKCLQIICTKTMDVIQDASFEDVELSTIITILDQDALNVDNELNLFFALNRFSDKHGLSEPVTDEQEQPEPSQSPHINVEAGPSNRPVEPQQILRADPQRVQDLPNIRDAVKKIRFLTLSPQQFAEGPARTSLLSQSEAFSILMNISTPNSVYPMPEGFTLNKNHRVFNIYGDSRSPSPMVLAPPANAEQIIALAIPQIAQVIPVQPASPRFPDFNHIDRARERMNDSERERRRSDYDNRFYCIRTIRQTSDILNTSVLDCSFTFLVDRSVSILGLQIPTQISPSGNTAADRYSEIIYAHLLDSHGSRMTYTHSNQRVAYDSVSEVLFDRAVFIQGNKVYKIGVVLNKIGFYQMHSVQTSVAMQNVTFTFNVGNSSKDTPLREGMIRGIIYSV